MPVEMDDPGIEGDRVEDHEWEYSDVRFVDVSFRYPTRPDVTIFDKLSITVHGSRPVICCVLMSCVGQIWPSRCLGW